MKIGRPKYEREFWKGHWSQFELRLNVDEQQNKEEKKLVTINET